MTSCLYSLCVCIHISDIYPPSVAEHYFVPIPGSVNTEIELFPISVRYVALYQECVQPPHSSSYLHLTPPVSIDPFSHTLPVGVNFNQSEFSSPLNQLIRLYNKIVCQQPWICFRKLFPLLRVFFLKRQIVNLFIKHTNLYHT